MKALISPDEVVVDPNTQEFIGVRVCDIVETAFEVVPTLFWVECPDEFSGSTHCYNMESGGFVAIPEYVPKATEAQPVSQGAQTL